MAIGVWASSCAVREWWSTTKRSAESRGEGAIGLSLACQVTGRGKWGNSIARLGFIGVYNNLIKLEGHDRYDRGNDSRANSRG